MVEGKVEIWSKFEDEEKGNNLEFWCQLNKVSTRVIVTNELNCSNGSSRHGCRGSLQW